MKHLTLLILICVLANVTDLLARTAAIYIDEDYADWTTELAGHVDVGSESSGVNLLNLQVSNDERQGLCKAQKSP